MNKDIGDVHYFHDCLGMEMSAPIVTQKYLVESNKGMVNKSKTAQLNEQ